MYYGSNEVSSGERAGMDGAKARADGWEPVKSREDLIAEYNRRLAEGGKK